MRGWRLMEYSQVGSCECIMIVCIRNKISDEICTWHEFDSWLNHSYNNYVVSN